MHLYVKNFSCSNFCSRNLKKTQNFTLTKKTLFGILYSFLYLVPSSCSSSVLSACISLSPLQKPVGGVSVFGALTDSSESKKSPAVTKKPSSTSSGLFGEEEDNIFASSSSANKPSTSRSVSGVTRNCQSLSFDNFWFIHVPAVLYIGIFLGEGGGGACTSAR